ncbi:MAG TPA: DUF4097 family beta strand repeat-containing protein [Lacunisphaera sp.]|jgi:DUF4097 and DUF4098 domain-containing protein YvlB
MKLRLLAFAFLAFSTAALTRADNYDSKETFTRTGAFDANGRVSLENVNGDVDIVTWDKNEILIEGEKSAKTDEELKLIDLKIDLSPSQATIKVRLPKRPGTFFGGNTIRAAVRFKLTVPVTAVLNKISTVNSSIAIAGVRGTVSASTVNGSLRTTGLGGDARLETVNGPVKASFDTLATGQKISCRTVNGQAVVAMPKDAGFELEASTVNGGIDCDFSLTLAGKHHDHQLSGKIGDGRASVEIGTVNGGIHLEAR